MDNIIIIISVRLRFVNSIIKMTSAQLIFLKQDTENIVFRRIFVRKIRWITFKVVMNVRIIYNNKYVYLMSPPIFDFRH